MTAAVLLVMRRREEAVCLRTAIDRELHVQAYARTAPAAVAMVNSGSAKVVVVADPRVLGDWRVREQFEQHVRSLGGEVVYGQQPRHHQHGGTRVAELEKALADLQEALAVLKGGDTRTGPRRPGRPQRLRRR